MKLKYVLLVLLCLVFAAAQETQNTDDKTAEQVSSMENKLGAQVRLLQLEKNIARNIEWGKAVIELLKDKNTSELEAILVELEALKMEVQNLDPNAENAVETFVNIKKEAIELSKEFRDKARPLLGVEEREKILLKLKNNASEEMNQYQERIRTLIREKNAEIAKKIFASMNITDDDLINKIKNGEANLSEVRQRIREEWKNMNQEQRKQVLNNLKEQRVKAEIKAREKIANALKKIQERKEIKKLWLDKALKKIEKKEVKIRLENYINKKKFNDDNSTDDKSNRTADAGEDRQNKNRGKG